MGLLKAATAEQVEQARRLLTSIEDRGFHRGKALVAELEVLLGG